MTGLLVVNRRICHPAQAELEPASFGLSLLSVEVMVRV